MTNNPFLPGDKVLTLRKGVEIEATVRTTWKHEVQVRAANGELLWRTMNTIRLMPAEEAGESVEQPVTATEDEPQTPLNPLDPPVTEEPESAEPKTAESHDCEPLSEPPSQDPATVQQTAINRAAKATKSLKKAARKFLFTDNFDD